MFTLLLSFACTCAAPVEAPAPGKLITPPANLDLPAAPSLDAFGLSIGKSDGPAIEAWLTAHNLTCPTAPSPRRTTVRYPCGGDLPPTVLTGRTLPGKGSSLLIVRGDTTPLQYFGATRKYSLPADAIADYTTTVAALVPTYSEPKRKDVPVEGASMDGAVVHYATHWAFHDLDINVVLMRAGGLTWSVSEAWSLPGGTSQDQTRPSTGHSPHGDGKKPSWHP